MKQQERNPNPQKQPGQQEKGRFGGQSQKPQQPGQQKDNPWQK